MKQHLNRTRRTATTGLTGLLVVLAFVAGHLTGYLVHPAQAADQEPKEFAVFWEAWDLVLAHFVDREQIDPTAMTYGAIEGMLASLGDEGHTTFLPPEAVERHESNLEGSFEGIGAYVAMEEGEITIVSPIDGSPAETAGILAGDIILTVDGTSVKGMSLNQVIGLIRGPADTEVVLTVRHPGAVDPVEIVIVRQRIELNSVNWSIIPGTTLAYLEITQFAADTGQEVEDALIELLNTRVEGERVTGIVLDLRNNPGGYLREAIRVASQFLPTGSTILVETDADDNTNSYRSQGWGYARDIPLVVLINEGTASAGEITAGAIKENGRGQLLGQTTFGTGTVLNQFSLSDGSAILLGVTNWLTPDGNLIKGQGVEPNVQIGLPTDTLLVDSRVLNEITFEGLLDSPDVQFLSALELLNGPLPAPRPAVVPSGQGVPMP